MRGVFIKFCIFITLCIILSGCQNRNQSRDNSLNLAKSIFVDCHYYKNQISRTYTDSHKIDVILRYLHKIDTKIQLMDHPQQTDENYCQITVTLTNGTSNIDEIRNKNYLRNSLGQWYAVDPDKANVIYHLVNHIESDKETAR